MVTADTTDTQNTIVFCGRTTKQTPASTRRLKGTRIKNTARRKEREIEDGEEEEEESSYRRRRRQ